MMRKTFTATIAALTALSTVATAIPASAQGRWRDSDRDGRSDRAEWGRDRDRDGRPDQWDHNDRRDWGRSHNRGRHHGWRDRAGRNWTYYGGNYGYDGYDGSYRVGQRYPYYQNRAYVIQDYGAYGLPAPRQGYRYYRDRNSGDIVLAAVAGGIIGLIIGQASR